MSKLIFTGTRPIRNFRTGSGASILARHLRSKGVPSSKAGRFATEIKNAMEKSKKRYGNDLTPKELDGIIRRFSKRAGDNMSVKDADYLRRVMFGKK
jgi:dephospho-CoA kinase